MKKMLFPIIRKYWKLLLAILLITAAGCAFTTGLAGGYRTLEQTMDDYLARYGYPDASITTEVTDRGKLEAILNVPGVRVSNARLCADTVVQNQDGRYLSLRIFTWNDGDVVQFHFNESAESNKEYQLYLDNNFAEAYGIHAGDSLRVRVGDEWHEAVVSALVSLPETLAVQPTNDGWDINADFGYAYASVHILEAEYDKVYSEAKGEIDEKSGELDAAKEDADSELSDARAQLDEAAATLEEKEGLLADSEMEADKKKQELERTRRQLVSYRAELVDKREQLVAGRSAAESGIRELTAARDRLNEASAALTTIDEQLNNVYYQWNRLNSAEAINAMEILRQAPQNTPIAPIAFALQSFESLLSSAALYSFNYSMDETASAVAARLRSFLDNTQSDADYLASAEAQSVVSRIEAGEEGIEETEEYQRLLSVVSKYTSVGSPEDMPSAVSRASAITNQILSLIPRSTLDSAVEVLNAFDPTISIAELDARINALLNAMALMESAMGLSFSTVGDVVSAYDDALIALNSARVELQSARAQITDALAAQGIAESEVPGTLASLNENIAKLESTIRQIDEGLPQIDDGLKQIDDGLAQINAGLKEIEQKLAEAKAQLAEARAQLKEQQSKYEQTAADVLMEFASLDNELASAYAQLDENQGYGELCNQFLLWFEDGADPDETLRAAEDALGGVSVKSDFTFARSAVKKRIEVNLKPIGTMSTFIPMVYFSVLLVIVFLFMSLIIRQCRREIGILRALGFTVNSIRGLFCGVNLAVTLAASVLGLGLGAFIAWYVGFWYIRFFGLPFISFRISLGRWIVSSLAAVAVGQIATLFSTGIVARISPAEAMSRPAPTTVRISGPVGRLTRRLPPMTAFSITTFFRNPLRFFFSAACVAATVMMVFSSLAYFTSTDYILKQTFVDRIHYDCQIFFSEPVDEKMLSELRALDYLSDVSNMPYYRTDISFGDQTEAAVVSSVDADSQLVGVTDRAGRQLSLQLADDGIILEQHLADKLGVQVGDTVLVGGTTPMRVEAISFQCISWSQYVSPAGASRLGEETIGSVIAHIDEQDEQKLLGYLVEQDNYLYIVFTRLSYQSSVELMSSSDFVAWITIIFSMGVGFLVVVNTSRTNVLEKKKELCILRTLGFQFGEISRSWFSQSILQFILAAIMGFPLGEVVARATLQKISIETREYAYANTGRELILTALLVFAYILLSHIVAMHDLKTWDMVEVVKEKE